MPEGPLTPPRRLPKAEIYHFWGTDPRNSEILPEDSSLPMFKLSSKEGLGGLTELVTLVLKTNEDDPGSAQGEVNWRMRKISVGKLSRTFVECGYKPNNTSPYHYWTWPSGKHTIKRTSSIWMAKIEGQLLAVYTGFANKNGPATLKIFAKLSQEEKIFLIITLMFSELREPPTGANADNSKTLGQRAAVAGVEAGASVAENVISSAATTAATGCCIIQ